MQEIRGLAQKYHINRVLAVRFKGKGRFKRTSDIDLAAEGGDFDRFALDVEEETSTLLKYDIVDLNLRHAGGASGSDPPGGNRHYEKI